ncbi:MAG: zf-HC2 domain-containing protein [Herpetosiphonaceae bacterium]|nr:zf-HC2 domain-containing protein [Herpetosiphonaceae bacterium]
MQHPERELYELAEGELTGNVAAETYAHLRTCPACQATFERLTSLHARLTALPQLQPSPALAQAVHLRIRALPRPGARPHWRVAGLIFAVGLLALLPSLDVLLGLFDDSVHLPAFTDWSGWFVWLEQLSANVEATLVVGLCAVAVACILVVAQTLTTLQPQVR